MAKHRLMGNDFGSFGTGRAKSKINSVWTDPFSDDMGAYGGYIDDSINKSISRSIKRKLASIGQFIRPDIQSEDVLSGAISTALNVSGLGALDHLFKIGDKTGVLAKKLKRRLLGKKGYSEYGDYGYGDYGGYGGYGGLDEDFSGLEKTARNTESISDLSGGIDETLGKTYQLTEKIHSSIIKIESNTRRTEKHSKGTEKHTKDTEKHSKSSEKLAKETEKHTKKTAKKLESADLSGGSFSDTVVAGMAGGKLAGIFRFFTSGGGLLLLAKIALPIAAGLAGYLAIKKAHENRTPEDKQRAEGLKEAPSTLPTYEGERQQAQSLVSVWHGYRQTQLAPLKGKGKWSSKWTPEREAELRRVAEEQGVDFNALKTMAYIESGGNPDAISNTGAMGMFQFVRSTAKEYGLSNPMDVRQSAIAASRYMKSNTAFLEKRNIPTDPFNVYMAHQQGPAGWAQIVEAAQLGKSVSQQVRRNMLANPPSSGRTDDPVAFIEGWRNDYERKYAFATQEQPTFLASTRQEKTLAQVAILPGLTSGGQASSVGMGVQATPQAGMLARNKAAIDNVSQSNALVESPPFPMSAAKQSEETKPIQVVSNQQGQQTDVDRNKITVIDDYGIAFFNQMLFSS